MSDVCQTPGCGHAKRDHANIKNDGCLRGSKITGAICPCLRFTAPTETVSEDAEVKRLRLTELTTLSRTVPLTGTDLTTLAAAVPALIVALKEAEAEVERLTRETDRHLIARIEAETRSGNSEVEVERLTAIVKAVRERVHLWENDKHIDYVVENCWRGATRELRTALGENSEDSSHYCGKCKRPHSFSVRCDK